MSVIQAHDISITQTPDSQRKADIHHKSYHQHKFSDQTGTAWPKVSGIENSSYIRENIPGVHNSLPRNLSRSSSEMMPFLGLCSV